MKRKIFKRGFTLVELLVVIAILAVLATVSIVGYSTFTKRARSSNDETIVTEWNKLLDGKDVLAVSNSDEKLNNINEVKRFFKENNSKDSDFTPANSGYHFYWHLDSNTIYLVEDEDTANNQFDIAYPSTSDNVTKDNTYRLDLNYVLISCDIEGVSINRNAIVSDTETTIEFADLTASTVMVGSTACKVENNKLTLKSTNDIAISQDTTVYLEGVAIDGDNNKTVYYLGTINLVANISPNDAATQNVTWSSSDSTIASIDQQGKVTANKVGTVTIEVIAEDLLGKHKGSCTIEVLPIKVDVPTANASLIYNGSEQVGVTLPNEAKYTLINNARTDAGNYTATATLEDKTNYVWNLTTPTTNDQSINWSIAKKNTEDTAPSAKTLTYTGSELELVNGGTTNGGTWQYKLSGGQYSTNIPTATNAGSYTINYKFVGDGNHNDVAEASVQVTINAKSLSDDMIPDISEQTYNGSAIIPDITVKDGETTLAEDTDYTVSYTNNTKAGSATVTITGKGNYTGPASKTFTINKATQTAPAAPSKDSATVTSTSVTLTAISAGQGNTKYGYNTENSANMVDNWKTELTFEGLTPNTTYYFFTKYEGNENYLEAVSETGTEIKTSPVLYTVTVSNVSNGSASADKYSAAAGDTITITVTPNNIKYIVDVDNSTVKHGDEKINFNYVQSKISFTMPASDVTVNVVLKEIQYN